MRFFSRSFLLIFIYKGNERERVDIIIELILMVIVCRGKSGLSSFFGASKGWVWGFTGLSSSKSSWSISFVSGGRSGKSTSSFTMGSRSFSISSFKSSEISEVSSSSFSSCSSSISSIFSSKSSSWPCSSSSTGGALGNTVTFRVVKPEEKPSVTVSVTWYSPSASYVCCTDGPIASASFILFPSSSMSTFASKSHSYEIMLPSRS